MKIPSQRALFDIPDDVAYLNCAYMSPLMHAARQAGEAGLRRKARPWEIAPAEFFDGSERLRAAYAELLGARPGDLALVPSVSYGVATAARNLPVRRGQNLVLAEEQFPSNVYPWRERAAESGAALRTVARPADGDWTAAVLAAIDAGTAVVALPQCHWIDGGLFDLERIAAACRVVGAALSLDLTQSLGVLPIDLARVQPDFVACAGYKWLMGPYSLGFLYAAPRWQDGGRPIEHNWITRRGAEDFARLVDYQDDFEPGARRFDVGERSNFALLPAGEAAARQLLDWGVDNIRETVEAMADEIVERVTPLGLTVPPKHLRAPHYLGLQRPGGLPPGLLPELAKHRVYVSVRGASIRVTPHVYNTPADIDRLVAALERVLG